MVKNNARGYLELFASPREFRILLLNFDQDYSCHRWTVDTPADLLLLQKIFEHFGDRSDFSWLEVLAFVNQNVELSLLNQGTYHKDFHESENSSL